MKKILGILFLTTFILCFHTLVFANDSEYIRSQENGTGLGLSVGGHELDFTYSSGAYGNLYIDGEFAESDVLWNYISNGVYVYYAKNNNIYKMDVTKKEKAFILSESDFPFIEGIYKDKYLYYGSMKYGDITGSLQDLIIFDLENSKEIGYIEDVGQMVIAENHIFTVPCTGDMSPLPLQQFDLNGSNPKLIAADAFVLKVINDQLFYSAFDFSEGYENYKVQIRKYNANTGTTTDLTDYYTRHYVKDIYNDHAVLGSWDTDDITVWYKDDITVYLNDERITFDQPPIIIDGRTLVPLRAIFEAMGASVDWNQSTKTVSSVKGQTTIELSIGSNVLYKNGAAIYLDVPAQIINDRTMVPVRAIAEAFGASVTWEENTRIVYINYEESKTVALLIAGYDTDENTMSVFNYSTRKIEDTLRAVSVNDITTHFMSDDDMNMTLGEFQTLVNETFANTNENDLSIIYYGGHSSYTGVDEDGHYQGQTTMFSGATFQRFYDVIKNNTRGTVLLIYDGCFAGKLLELSGYDDRIKIIAACDADDESTDMMAKYLGENVEKDEMCSILAYAFNDLIESNAFDNDDNNIITFDELHLNLMNKVINVCQRYTTSEGFFEEMAEFYLHWFEAIGKLTGIDGQEEYRHSIDHRSLAQQVQAYPNNDKTPLFRLYD